eukprot:COSAG06_NODE_5174_length_3662_cov_2.173730_2_plen_72_part_00
MSPLVPLQYDLVGTNVVSSIYSLEQACGRWRLADVGLACAAQAEAANTVLHAPVSSLAPRGAPAEGKRRFF